MKLEPRILDRHALDVLPHGLRRRHSGKMGRKLNIENGRCYRCQRDHGQARHEQSLGFPQACIATTGVVLEAGAGFEPPAWWVRQRPDRTRTDGFTGLAWFDENVSPTRAGKQVSVL